jgi:hypothetical protein
MPPNFSILIYRDIEPENIKILISSSRMLLMKLTFFCKRGFHNKCPGDWPVADESLHDHDCSFDVRKTRCLCECHVVSA